MNPFVKKKDEKAVPGKKGAPPPFKKGGGKPPMKKGQRGGF